MSLNQNQKDALGILSATNLQRLDPLALNKLQTEIRAMPDAEAINLIQQNKPALLAYYNNLVTDANGRIATYQSTVTQAQSVISILNSV